MLFGIAKAQDTGFECFSIEYPHYADIGEDFSYQICYETEAAGLYDWCEVNKNEFVSQLVIHEVNASQKLHYIQFGVNMGNLTPPSGYCDVNYNALDGLDLTGAGNN